MIKTLKNIMFLSTGTVRSISSITAPIGDMKTDLLMFAEEKRVRLLEIEAEMEALGVERKVVGLQAERAITIAEKLGALL